jgi:hypothetical protein
LVGAIKHFNPLLGLRTKEEAAMPLIYILQNGTIIELVTSSMNEARTLALEG